VFHLVEGAIEIRADAQAFDLSEADACCIPGYPATRLANRSADAPAFVYLAD
jgi:gentisate 1,2-dioxygenase